VSTRATGKQLSWLSALDSTRWCFSRIKRMATFFVFSMLLGAALQITNIFGEAFLHSSMKHFPILCRNTSWSSHVNISDIGDRVYSYDPFFVQRFELKWSAMSNVRVGVAIQRICFGNPADGFHS